MTAAWRHGWQPAELVRHVNRETGEAHAQMAADMIADEMRGYAPATVDDRWQAQLAALGHEPWWGNDAAADSCQGGRTGVDRSSVRRLA